MTFTPLVHGNEIIILLLALLASIVSTCLFVLVSNLISSHSKKESKDITIDWSFMVFGVVGIIAFFGITEYQTQKNITILSSNVSQKYTVEDITLAPRTRMISDIDPTQRQKQQVTIKVSGESRLATLTVDKETSEPTLLNVDTGKPLEDIIKK